MFTYETSGNFYLLLQLQYFELLFLPLPYVYDGYWCAHLSLIYGYTPILDKTNLKSRRIRHIWTANGHIINRTRVDPFMHCFFRFYITISNNPWYTYCWYFTKMINNRCFNNISFLSRVTSFIILVTLLGRYF